MPEAPRQAPFGDTKALPVQYVYADHKRTHELHVSVEDRDGRLTFVTVELPFGSRDMQEAVLREEPLDGTWETALFLRDLEARLARSGRYYRMNTAEKKWEPIAFHETNDLPLQGHAIPIPGAKDPRAILSLHHFHQRDSSDSLLLVSMPRLDVATERFVLADVRFQFPDIEKGEVNVRHTRLGPGVLRSQMVEYHIELPEQGFKKLVTPLDYSTTFGVNWQKEAQHTFKVAGLLVLDPERHKKRKEAAAEPKVVIEDHGLLAVALASKPVLALERAHVEPQDEEKLLSQGELAIRRFITQRRKAVTHYEEQHLVSLLEAVLLCRYGMRSGRRSLVEAEGPRLLRLHKEATASGLLR